MPSPPRPLRCRHSRFFRNNSNDSSEPEDGTNSELLQKDTPSCHQILKDDEENEIKITGYRRSVIRTIFCWLFILLTGGLLRLFLHWWRYLYLLATYSPCPLEIAEKVLVRENYEGKHKMYYIKDIVTLDADTYRKLKCGKSKNLKKLIPTDDDTTTNYNEFKISLHYSSAEFRHVDAIRFFSCKQLRYIWDTQTRSFRKLKGLDTNVPSTYLHHQKGLSKSEHLARRIIYGANEITIPIRGIFTMLFLEVLNPYFSFQIFSVMLWISYSYYLYAGVIVIMSVFGVSSTIIQTKKNERALRKTVQNNGRVRIVYEDKSVEEVDTNQLVPGDVIQIPSSGCLMLCDAVLLSGNCIVDESMLTGESVPITKTPFPLKRDLIFDTKEHNRHTLFCGTKVIQTRYIGSEKVLAVVINTGYITAKGGLIRSILYPPPVDYKFERDSYKFIGLLACVACIGFVYTLVSKIKRGVTTTKIAIESLDLVTIAVPPALPAAMTVGRLNAQKRLKRKDIYCISPRSLNVAGSIDCVCFDKTGTLTEDGLDMWGVVPKSETNQFQIPLKHVERLPLDNFLYGMVSCHSITFMNDEMKGDPLDLKMFESTGWILEEAKVADDLKYDLIFPTIVRQPKNKSIIESNTKTTQQLDGSDDDVEIGSDNDIGIIRQFSFTSNLQRMSVITRKLSDNHYNVYCKGSPEMLQTLCCPETLPENYSNQLDYYARQGYRIIALAYKPLDKKMTYAKIQKIGRDKIECDLEFLGFVILENRLKPDTTDVIKQLTAANIRTVMVTGDNILTALSVAKKCCMVTPKQSIITVNVRQNSQDPGKYELYYNLTGTSGTASSPTNVHALNGGNAADITSSVIMTDSNSVASLETIATWTHRDVEMGLPEDYENVEYCTTVSEKLQPQDNCLNLNNYRFAMIGETWAIVQEHFPELLPKFLTRGTIFARMLPENKQSLVLELQKLGYCVAMCGDGANDCGALKAAHVGISLSDAESSVASPFTSKKQTIACVPDVIKEGRAALVTSFGTFKYMAGYSLVQFASVLMLYAIDSNLSDMQFLFIDLFIISLIAFFYGRTEAYEGPLHKLAPISSLMSKSSLVSMAVHIIVAIIFQVGGLYHIKSQSWFKPFNSTDINDDTDLASYENYTIFIISGFQYIILAFVFSKAKPYRKSIVSNFWLLAALILATACVIFLGTIPNEYIATKFQLLLPPFESKFRYYILAYGLANFLISLLFENFVIDYLFNRKRLNNKNKSHHKYLVIEDELRENYNWPPLSCYQNDINSAINNEDNSSPLSYAEIGAEHGIDLGHQLMDQNNSVLNRFFESSLSSSSSSSMSLVTVDQPLHHHQHNHQLYTEHKVKSNLMNDNCDNKNENKLSPDKTDGDDDGLSNIDSESAYETIQNDFIYGNGSQENVLSSSSSTSNLVKSGLIMPQTPQPYPTQQSLFVPASTTINNNNDIDIKKNEFILQNNDLKSINEKSKQSNINAIEMMVNPITLSLSSSSDNNSLEQQHQHGTINPKQQYQPQQQQNQHHHSIKPYIHENFDTDRLSSSAIQQTTLIVGVGENDNTTTKSNYHYPTTINEITKNNLPVIATTNRDEIHSYENNSSPPPPPLPSSSPPSVNQIINHDKNHQFVVNIDNYDNNINNDIQKSITNNDLSTNYANNKNIDNICNDCVSYNGSNCTSMNNSSSSDESEFYHSPANR